MSSHQRRFYGRYYFLTILAPAYIIAALHYGLAWLLLYLTAGETGRFGTNLIFPLVLFLVLLAPLALLGRWLTALAFRFTGVAGRKTTPTADESARLRDALAVASVPAGGPGKLEPVMVDLGGVPFLAVSDGNPPLLWVSRGILRDLAADDLACMVAHEAGHATARVPVSHHVIKPLTWLAALFFAIFFQALPLLYLALGLIHALAWLRIELWTTLWLERRADGYAMERMGRETYAAALVRSYRLIAGPESLPGIRQRLERGGLTGEELTRVLTAAAGLRPGSNDSS